MRSPSCGRFALSGLWLALTACLPALADTTEVEFDTGILQARGLDPRLAEEFRSGARFPAGMNRVKLMVNGQERGKASVRFTAGGDACLTAALARQGQLTWSGEDATHATPDQCVTAGSLWPQAEVRAMPGEGTLELFVPEDAILNGEDYLSWEHGGHGVLLNYSAQYMKSRSAFSAFSYRQVQTEAGFNVADWIVRSTQNWSDFSEGSEFRHQNAWVQKTLYDHKSVLQAGRINLSVGTTGGGRVLGMQVTPEAALYGKPGAAVVTGIADDTSVVEIRQQNVLLHRTSVPQGPFALRGFTLLNLTSDLVVTVVNSDGSQREYSVPPTVYRTGESTVRPGLSWGFGRWDQDGYREHPWVGALSTGWQLMPRLGVQSEAFVAKAYQALNLSTDTQLPGGQGIAVGVAASLAKGKNGLLASASASQPLPGEVSLSLNGSWQTNGYREFTETLSEDQNTVRNRAQFGPSLSWSHPWAGSTSLSWIRSLTSEGRHSDYAQLGWTRRIAGAYLSITAGRSTDSVSGRQDDRVYASLQIPLGKNGSLTGYVHNSGNQTRYGSRYTWRQSQRTNWSVSAEQSHPDGKRSFSGTVNTVAPWTHLSGNVSTNSDKTRSVSLLSSGGVLLSDGVVLFSPYRITETFGTVSVDGMSGVRVETPAGPVWTNRKGKAVLPSLSGWQTSTISLDATSLNKGSDVVNGYEEIRLARGAVSRVGFAVVSTRRVLIRVTDAQGGRLPPRATVYDDQGQFMSVTSEDGTVFISDARPGMALEIEGPSTTCSLSLTDLPEQRPAQAGLYEELTAVCRQ
ncbi:fimbria/pilus outer membrane usher protein [Enterobacter chuandaensis]|uniref:fimbria/pilus outer membrane usher protein n=1 Tax=Enterobacter chuandaensis TaxID=2497875 RepID=UPI00207504B7|nr:fimbria/pilus outer membrane usher protein [Enterobacter chuandaensis]MCM7588017.1 fimbria/pilus outer membrane usher protein [Enterobacter chuandaensis]